MRKAAAPIWKFVPLSLAVVFSNTGNAQDLGSFAVLAGTTITNTGNTVINGNIGVSPGTAITGFPPGVVQAPYAAFRNDAVAIRIQNDLTTAYNVLAGRPTTVDLTGQDLGGLTLGPGVYNFNSSSQLTGTLVLDAKGDPNAIFIFKTGSTLTTASASRIQLINGASGANVYFQVGSSATLGGSTDFAGKIFALTDITLVTGADIDCGAALARNGAVTLDTNTISICSVPPAPGGNGGSGGSGGSSGSGGVTPGTYNQQAVTRALDRYAARGAVLPLTFQVLRGILTPAELAQAVTQLTGEVGAGVAPTGFQATNAFMSLLSDNAFGDERGAVVVQEEAPQRATVRVLGYAPDDVAPRGPFGALRAPHAAPAPRLWSVWAAAYGGQTQTNGASDTGAHDRSLRTVGIAAGVDYRVTPDTKIGFALAGGESRFSLANGMGSSAGDVFQAALYARTNFGPAYVTGVLAYAWHDMKTSRIVTLGGDDTLTAAFKAHNIAGQVEAGYRFGWFTPYAALGVQAFTTPTYAERAADGVSVFALSYDGRTAIATRSQLGFRAEHTIALADGMALRLRTRAAWAHDFGATPFVDASFQSVPGAVFRVRGAEPPRDSLLLSAGAELQLANGFSVSGMFDTQLASSSQSYAGRAQLRYTW